MIYTIENELLKVSVTTSGAQICSVVRKCDGVEHMHNADKAVLKKICEFCYCIYDQQN